MSEPLRIALVAEGITDYVVLNAAIASILDGHDFNLSLLQPEESVAFMGSGAAGILGGGWKGVFKWCIQAAARSSNNLGNDPTLDFHDLLILHMDADVANETAPPDLPQLAERLPCEKPCPPAEDTTNELRNLILLCLGEDSLPHKAVFCTPSKSTEAWVMKIFFESDRDMTKKGWECHPNPSSRLSQQPLSHRFKKTRADYERRQQQMKDRWSIIVMSMNEAQRFQNDFIDAID